MGVAVVNPEDAALKVKHILCAHHDTSHGKLLFTL